MILNFYASLYIGPNDITYWLDKLGVGHYELIPDPKYGFYVDVKDSIFLQHKRLKEIKLKFNHVLESFLANRNCLTSLISCNHNLMSGLVNIPVLVGIVFICNGNPISPNDLNFEEFKKINKI